MNLVKAIVQIKNKKDNILNERIGEIPEEFITGQPVEKPKQEKET